MGRKWAGGAPGGSLGPCNMYYETIKGSDIFRYLQRTADTALKAKVGKSEIKFSQYGTSKANAVKTGAECSVQIALGEADIEVMEASVDGFRVKRSPNGTIIGASFGAAIGEDDLSIARKLKLVRIVDDADSTDPFDTLTFWLAAPAAEFELKWDAGSQRFVGNMFDVYRDPLHPDIEEKPTFFGIGDFGPSS